MRVVYLDTLFFLNVAADYLLLLLTAKAGGIYPKRRRLLLGAALGAILSVLFYFPVIPAAVAWMIRVGVCILTVFAAFYEHEQTPLLRLSGIFIFLTFLLAGIVLLLSMYTGGQSLSHNGIPYAELSGGAMLVCFGAAYLLSGFVLGRGRGHIGRRFHEIEAIVKGKPLRFRALEDSGNLLRDPISGKSVIVTQISVFRPIFSRTTFSHGENLSEHMEELCAETGLAFRLIPAHTASGTFLIPAFSPKKLTVDGQEQKGYLLGLSTQDLEIGGDCRALMGGTV